jgi:predicted nucleic acid-binding protein
LTFVLDASFAFAWCFDEDATIKKTRATLAALHSDFVMVPPVWPLEISNGLIMAERRGRISPQVRDDFVALIDSIDIRVEPVDAVSVFATIMPLARRERLTAYDASYLELAMRLGLALATLDADLTAAARRVGVDVIGG